MKRFYLLLLAAVSAVCAMADGLPTPLADGAGNAVAFVNGTDDDQPDYQELQSTLPLIPFPQTVRVSEGVLTVDTAAVLADVTAVVEADTVGDAQGAIRFALDKTLGSEAYRLDINADGILVTAASRQGFIYGVQTVRQLAMLQGNELGYLSIEDEPRFEHRGLMMDFSRHWFPKEEVLKVLDVMALYKMSRLHMHLTDDQGWRIEIPEYPLLTTKGAVRAGSLTNKGSDPFFYDDTPYGEGCFFTLDDLREIVAYAAARGITCYPEVDLPGHMVAAITAYPEFSCDETRKYEVRIEEGISSTILNVAKPEVITFLKTVLGHLAEIFPAPYMHIGGDECPMTDWNMLINKGDAQFTKFMADNGLSAATDVQPWLVNELGTWLKEQYGKDVVVWDELTVNWDPDKYHFQPIVMAWRSLGYTKNAGALGFKSIAAPTYPNYWDQMQCTTSMADLCELYQGGYGDTSVNTMQSVYNLNPTSAAGDYGDLVIGTQANLWAEAVADCDELEYQFFPRALALSEVGWLANDKKGWDGFLARIQSHAAVLDALDVVYAKHYFNKPATTTSERNLAEARAILANQRPNDAGYPSQEAYDALQAAVDEGKLTTTQYSTFKRSTLNQPDPAKTYRILSASTYYKAKYIGSSVYASGDNLRFHYTQQTEPEELFRFVETATSGAYRLVSVATGREVSISSAGASLVESGEGTLIKMQRATTSATGGNGVSYNYVHGAVALKTGSYGLYGLCTGVVGTNNTLQVCYPGTWFLEEVTDFTAEARGLVRKCQQWLQHDSGEDGEPAEEALDLLLTDVYQPAVAAVATGYVSQTTYEALCEAYARFLAIPLKSYASEIDEGYYYYIRNYYRGDYAVSNVSTRKVVHGTRNATTGLWGVFKNDDGTVSIVSKQNPALHATPASIASAAELNLAAKPVKWVLRYGETDEAKGVNILEPTCSFSWYSTGGGTFILRPKAWGAGFWVFEKSDVETGISSVLLPATGDPAAVYDLQGRRVQSPQKGGVYVKGGRKVVY
ncbi:MAG: beta-N-acetylhexosaminidase [Bacteroidaceae bacterium]|nr:beta-N-acetylhexosaminidase [Bacteroidaceae bacterium]